MNTLRALRRAVPLLVISAAVAACSDRNPVDANLLFKPLVPAGGSSTVLECTADVQPRSVSCTSARPAGGPSADLLVGGQNVYVKLRSSNVALSGGVLSADVTVQNLLAQAMGTADGVTPSPAGVRVFFASDPTVTVGSGTVTLSNADGTGAFTATGQKYYQYDGILAPGATSPAKNWHFQMSAGVTQFVFTVYVAAALPAENGYIRLEPQNVLVAPGNDQFISSWIVSAVGAESQNSAAMKWSISDTTVAKIDAQGNVTAVAPGTAVVTATDGVRSGTTTIFVGAADKTAPALTGFSRTPSTVAAGDTVAFSVSASDAGTGLRSVQVTLRSPTAASQASCTTYAPVSGTAAAGTYQCKAVVAPGARAGTWSVYTVTLIDHSSNYVQIGAATLASRGYPSTVAVTDAAVDSVPPTLTGFSLSPATVTAGDSVTAAFTVADAGVGVDRAMVSIYNSASNRSSVCVAAAPATGTAASGTFQCRLATSAGAANGAWSVSNLQVIDRAGNGLSLNSSGLLVRGFSSGVTLTGGTNDTNSPTLTSLTLSPNPVAVGDSLTVTVGVADPGSGAGSIYLELRSPISSEVATCQSAAPASGTRANGTFTCKVGFISGAPAGTWTLNFLQLFDGAGNDRNYAAGDLKGLGYPSTVTVTP